MRQSPTHDYHVHSSYSDGEFLHRMARAAESAGLDAVGFADHCNVSAREPQRRATRRLGFNLDATYERRRRAIDGLRDEFDLRLFDAVEMDYDPRDEAEIRAFLADANFDYSVGSVHVLDGANVHDETHFAAKSEAERRRLVDDYVDALVSLVASDLFEIAAHVDLPERNPALRGLFTADHYDRIAAAFEDARTVPEVNAGRVRREYGEFHPAPPLLDALLDRGVGVVLGTDSHAPDEVGPRLDLLTDHLRDRGVSPATLDV